MVAVAAKMDVSSEESDSDDSSDSDDDVSVTVLYIRGLFSLAIIFV